MGNKIKSKNKDGEIRIITDKPKNLEYTFIDDGLNKQSLSSTSNHRNDYGGLSGKSEKTEEKNNIPQYSIRRHSNKLKRNSIDYMRFKSSKITKSQAKQNHSPVYE